MKNLNKIILVTLVAVLFIWNIILTINLVTLKGDFQDFYNETMNAHKANLSLWETQLDINSDHVVYFSWLGVST